MHELADFDLRQFAFLLPSYNNIQKHFVTVKMAANAQANDGGDVQQDGDIWRIDPDVKRKLKSKISAVFKNKRAAVEKEDMVIKETNGIFTIKVDATIPPQVSTGGGDKDGVVEISLTVFRCWQHEANMKTVQEAKENSDGFGYGW